jgi:hypothetical protein
MPKREPPPPRFKRGESVVLLGQLGPRSARIVNATVFRCDEHDDTIYEIEVAVGESWCPMMMCESVLERKN